MFQNRSFIIELILITNYTIVGFIKAWWKPYLYWYCTNNNQQTPCPNLGSTTSKKSAGFSIFCTDCSQCCYSNTILTLGILAQYFYKQSRSRFRLKTCWSCISTFSSNFFKYKKAHNVHDKDVHHQNSITKHHTR